MLRTFFNAFAEIMLGAVLLDVLAVNVTNAGAVQSAATGARGIGSLVAFGLGLLVYRPGISEPVIPDRTVIALTAVCPLALAFAATFLPPGTPVPGAVLSQRSSLPALCLVMLQITFLWAGLKTLVSDEVWLPMLAGLPVASALIIGAISAWTRHRRRREWDLMVEVSHLPIVPVRGGPDPRAFV